MSKRFQFSSSNVALFYRMSAVAHFLMNIMHMQSVKFMPEWCDIIFCKNDVDTCRLLLPGNKTSSKCLIMSGMKSQ